MTTTRVFLSTLAVVLAVCWMAACQPPLTEREAADIANKRLLEYAEKENLDPALFGEPEVISQPGEPRLFHYTSDGRPRHLVAITIDSCGDMELHRMIEE